MTRGNVGRTKGERDGIESEAVGCERAASRSVDAWVSWTRRSGARGLSAASRFDGRAAFLRGTPPARAGVDAGPGGNSRYHR